MKDKMNVILDSNLRNPFYRNIEFHNKIILEVKRFARLKRIKPLVYVSPFSFYEEASLRRVPTLNTPNFDEAVKRMNSSPMDAEQARVLTDLAEEYMINISSQIDQDERYSRDNILSKFNSNIPYINHDELKKRYLSDIVEEYDEEKSLLLKSFIAFEYLQDKFLQANLDHEKRAAFLITLFMHFLPDNRSNSLFRSAHQIWVESFSIGYLRSYPEQRAIFQYAESKFRIRAREDFVDNEIIHYAVMGNRITGSKVKFLAVTNDPILNVLYRISLYKFTVAIISEMGRERSSPIHIPKMNFGYIGCFHNDSIRWINVAEIPSIAELQDETTLQRMADKLMRD